MNERFGLSEKNRDELKKQEIEEGIDLYNAIKHEFTEEKIDRIVTDLISPEEFEEKNGKDGILEIYSWYEDAIRRREREPLPQDRFIAHFFEGRSLDEPKIFGEYNLGYLLGFQKYGVFIPTHFAPKTLRGGLKLITELGDHPSIPAVMAITEDLRDTIVKIPSWKEYDLSFMAEFMRNNVGKKIVYNSHPDTKRLMLGVLTEYMNEHRS